MLIKTNSRFTSNLRPAFLPPRLPPPQAGYLRELLVSCPRGSTRAAFERLAADAIAHADPEGAQAAAMSRVLLDLLDEETQGAARGMSPGGLAHVAPVVGCAAAAGGSQLAVLIAGGAVPRLLGCLKARHAYEANSSNLSSSNPSSSSLSSPSRPPHAAARRPLLVEDVAGFPSVVDAVARLLAGAGAVEEALGGATGVGAGGGAAALVERQFLSAALRACPGEAADLLTQLVWRGSRLGAVTAGSAAASGAAAGSTAGEAPRKEESGVAAAAARGGQEDEGGGFAAELDAGGGGSRRASEVGERALAVLLEIVLDARRAASSSVTAATAATSGVSPAAAAAVSLASSMGVLSRVLHLRDGGAAQGRLEVALGKLAAAASEEERHSTPPGGCGGGVYLTGKLIASLFVHVPEARPVLSRMPQLIGSRGRVEPSSSA